MCSNLRSSVLPSSLIITEIPATALLLSLFFASLSKTSTLLSLLLSNCSCSHYNSYYSTVLGRHLLLTTSQKENTHYYTKSSISDTQKYVR